MILSLLLLVPLVGLVIWMYFRLASTSVSRRFGKRYDTGVFFVAGLACASAALYAYRTVGAGVDRAWWPIIAVLYSLLILVLVLAIAGLIRNLIDFRKER
jgi:hypothetical protein